jgi:hypothetical protein
MSSHYYLVKNLVVDYVSQNGRIHKLIINKEKKRLSVISLEKYGSGLISENNKKKMFFENNVWSSDTRRKKYSKKLVKEFPEINKFLKVYEDVSVTVIEYN